MLILRTTLLLAIVATFALPAEAQLFRLRRTAQQPQQAPANYNAAAYQYTQLQAPVTNVPSQRYVQQPQCNQRVVYVPVQMQGTQRGLVPQQRTQQMASSQQVVMLTFRDPRSGRLFQRPYLITQPTNQATQPQPQTAQQMLASRQQGTPSPTSPESVLSTATPNGVVTPTVEPDTGAEKVATASFDSPVTPPVNGYSVLDAGGEEIETETSLPELKLEEAKPQTVEPIVPVPVKPVPSLPGTTEPAKLELVEPGGLELDGDGGFDLDLPPLGSDGT